MRQILIIEDDPDIVTVVQTTLEADGFDLLVETDGQAGLTRIKESPPALLLLDLTLPRMSGLDICRAIRRDKDLNRIPIIMLTARAEVSDKILGLELGADDYMTKPFDPKELAARIRALLRRVEPSETAQGALQIGSLRIDPDSYSVTRDGEHVPMSTLEFRLLYYLAAHPGKVFGRDQLLDAVWGSERFVTPRIVDVYIRSLREKIEETPSQPTLIRTRRGAGYLFEAG